MTPNLTWLNAEPVTDYVSIGGKKYLLREASAGAAKRHQDTIIAATKISEKTGKPSSLGGLGEADIRLLSDCLVEELPEAERKPGQPITKSVEVQVIRGWPNRIVEPLLKHLHLISGMSTPDTVEGLEKTIAEAQQKLTVLKEQAAGGMEGDGPKN